MYFARDYKDLKGLVHEMDEMKIDIKPEVRPVKKRLDEMKIDIKPDVRPVKKPYKLAHKYKEIVNKEIDNMLATRIIYPIDQSEWASPMVVQPRNMTQPS